MKEASVRPPNKLYNFDEHKQLQTETLEDAQAEDAIRALNNEYLLSPLEHFKTVSEAMRPPITPDSPPYAIFEDEDSSRDTALVVALPFASSIVPDISPELTVTALRDKRPKIDSNEWHNGEKHYTLFRIMKALGIRDTEGRTIPVIALASPSKDWRPHFSPEQKAKLRDSDFAPFAGYIQEILDYEGIGQVHIGGYSMGAAIPNRA